MSMQHPRDLREWQRYIERGLADAVRGTSIAINHANDQDNVVRDEVDGYKNLTPTNPVTLVYQTSTYIAANGYRRARVVVDFPDVILSTTAEAITVNNYELSGQDQGQVPLDAWRTLATSDTSALMALDFAPGSIWKFRVRALSGNFTKPGLWSAETQVTMVSDTTPPPQPSAPVATLSLGVSKVAWDGLAAGGAAMPADFARLEVAFGLATSPTTIIDTYYSTSPTFTMVPKSAYNVPHYFRFRAVDTSGNVGPWSAQATTTPVPLVDVDLILSVLDGATTTIKNVGSAALIDGAVTNTKLADNSIAQVKLQDQIISLAKLDTTVDAKITKGITDAATADGKAVTAQNALDAAKLTYDAKIAQLIARGASLVRNGDFEATPTGDGWAASGSLHAVEALGVSRSGTKSLRIGPNPAVNAWPLSSDWVPSATGRTYYLEGWFKRTGTEVKTQGVGFVVQVKTAAGGTSTPVVGKVDSTVVDTAVWTKVTTTYTVTTADTVAAHFAPWIVAGNNVYNVDDFLVIDITEAEAARLQVVTAQADATKAIADAAVALTAANSKNIITNSTANASSGIPGKTSGDRWQKWTTLATGGKLLATWRWDGTQWIAEAMDATYIPLIDIGAGTFGTLNGNQFAANTISVKNLLVGSFDNVIPDPYFTNTNLEWGAVSSPYSFPATEGYGGLSALKIGPDAVQRGRYSQRIPVEGGSSYRVQVWVKSDVAIPAGALGLYHNYAVAGSSTALGSTNFLKQTNGSTGNDAIPANTWTLLTGTAKLNALADTAAFGFYKQSTFSTGTVWYSQASAVRMGDGNLLVDGSVTALAMAANAVDARVLRVGDFQNLAIGADFEDAAAVPFSLTGLHTISTTQKKFGTSSLRLASGTGVQSSGFTGDFRVKDGEQYYFKYWAYIDATFNGTSGGSKLRIGDQASNHIVSIAFNAITRSTWVPMEGTVTVPAGDTALTVSIQSDHTAGLAYIDDIQIRRVSEASLIQNLGVEKLVASAASIAQAVIDKLWTDVVQSRKITTDMLVVTAGTNMVPDPLFQAPESRAKKYGNATGWDTYVSGVGMQAIRYGNTTPSWPSVGYLNLFDYDSTPAVADKTNWLPVIPGEKYEFSGRFYANDAGITTKMYVTFVKDDGTTSGWSSTTITPNLTTPATERIPVWEFTIPANVIKMGARIEHRGTAGWVSLYNDGMYFRKKVDANLIVDGGVLAKHLTVTDEMWTNILHFKKLTGAEIDANALTADTSWIGVMRGGILINDAVTTSILKADAITSKHTITGATIQTVATALRGVKITSTGIKGYDSVGAKILDIGTGTSNLLVGDVMTSKDGVGGIRLINSSSWGLPAIVYSYNGNQGVQEASSFMRYSISGDPELVHRAPDRAIVGGTGLGFVRVEGDLVLSLGNGASGAQQMRVEQPFNLDAWSPQTGYQAMTLNGKLTTINAVAGNLKLDAGAFYVQMPSTYGKTTGTSGNVVISSDGGLFRSTSALKYKADPQVIEPDDRLLDVPMKDWIDKFALESKLALEAIPREEWDESMQARYDSISIERIPGAIAEDVIAAGGARFATYDGVSGEVEGLMYDRYVLARTDILARKHRALEAEHAELLARFNALEARLPA